MIYVLKDLMTGKKIPLTEQKEYVVGRKNCEILLENDQSISRRHAIIKVKDDCVTLEDCKSRYNTQHNGTQISPKIEIKLQHMDVIHFGALNSKFCFEAYRFITAASALSPDKKMALKENIAKCNGKYVDKWSSSCTHLTVEKITLTIKVLQALIDEKPIVTPEYWKEYSKSIENGKAPPDISLYNKPPVAEQLLRSDFQYKLDTKRKTLFSNKVFVFLSSSVKTQMEEVIKNCGGDLIAWQEDKPKMDEINSSPREYLFVKSDSDEENASFDAIVKKMAKIKKRAILLNEIALAIVHCSCEINCNPNFNKVNEVFGSRTQKQQTLAVLAPETQTENMVPSISNIKIEKIIPPSLKDDWVMETETSNNNSKVTVEVGGVKRPNESQDEMEVTKKIKTDEEEFKKIKNQKPKSIEEIPREIPSLSTKTSHNDNTMKKPKSFQKRKAEEDIENPNLKKINPFSLIKVTSNHNNKVLEEKNPFELIKTTKPSTTKTSPIKRENPFAHITCLGSNSNNTLVRKNIVPKQETKTKNTLTSKKSDVLCISSWKKSSFNTTWMSKSTASVKIEIKDEDPQLLKIAEAFQNCVKVEMLPMYTKKEISKQLLNNVSVDRVDGKKNFKTFLKIKPLKQQVTIIPRSHLTKVAPGEVIGIEVNTFHDSDDELPVVSHINQKGKQRVKSSVKRFVLN